MKKKTEEDFTDADRAVMESISSSLDNIQKNLDSTGKHLDKSNAILGRWIPMVIVLAGIVFAIVFLTS